MMNNKETRSEWDVIGTVGTIGVYVTVLSFFFLLGAACYDAAYVHGGEYMTFWEVVVNSVVPAAITGLVTVAVSYFLFLKKMPERVAKELDKKMDPSNLSLQSEQHQIQAALNPSNAVLHGDHEKLRSYLEEAAKRQAAADERHAVLRGDDRRMVDAVQTLDGFALIFTEMNQELIRLRQENQQQAQKIVALEKRLRLRSADRDELEL